MRSDSRPVITLTKHHGLGNDFLVAVEPPRPLTSEDAVAWCDRTRGIGADGLILASAVTVGAAAGDDGPTPRPGAVRRWRMVLWNSDGGRAEISGNGLRCLAQALAAHSGHDGATDLDLIIDTDAGTRQATVLATDGGRPSPRSQVRVGMGKAVDGPAPSERWADLGVTIIDQVGVDLGNPHLVAFVDDGAASSAGAGQPDGPHLPAVDMERVGPVIEADHPGGLNVHVARVTGPDRLGMVIWERGAGVTMACGSGACAAAWAANRAGLVGERVTVEMPGGAALVELDGDEVVLVGPAVRVAEIRVDA